MATLRLLLERSSDDLRSRWGIGVRGTDAVTRAFAACATHAGELRSIDEAGQRSSSLRGAVENPTRLPTCHRALNASPRVTGAMEKLGLDLSALGAVVRRYQRGKSVALSGLNRRNTHQRVTLFHVSHSATW